MADSVSLKAFPSNENEAIAFLYVQRQDLTGKTPEEIYTMYLEALYSITKDNNEKKASGWFKEHFVRPL